MAKKKPDFFADVGGFFSKGVGRVGLAVATGGASELVRAGVDVAKGKKIDLGRTALSAVTGGLSEGGFELAGALDKKGMKKHPPRKLQRRPQGLYDDRRHLGRISAGHLPGHVPNAALGRNKQHGHGPGAMTLARPRGRLHPQRRHLGRLAAGHKLHE